LQLQEQNRCQKKTKKKTSPRDFDAFGSLIKGDFDWVNGQGKDICSE